MAALMRTKCGRWVHDIAGATLPGVTPCIGALVCGSTPTGQATRTSRSTTCPKCLAVRAARTKARERQRHRPRDYGRLSASFPVAEVAVFNAVYLALRNGRDVGVLIARSDFQRLVVRFRAMAARSASQPC